MSVVFEVARCGASTQLRPDLASTVGPSEAGQYKGPRKYRPAGLLHSATAPRAPASFNNTGTQPRCALVVGVATYKKAKTQTQPHPKEPRVQVDQASSFRQKESNQLCTLYNQRSANLDTKNTSAFKPASNAASHLAPAGAQGQAQDKPLFFTAASPHHFPWKYKYKHKHSNRNTTNTNASPGAQTLW